MAVRSTRTRGRRSRRAPPAQTAAGRLPVGTPSQPPAPHAHIKVVPYRRGGDEARNLDDTPTFRSTSLQFDQKYSFTSPTDSDTATFADMARGYHKKDIEDLGKQTSSPMTLGTFVKLQPGRNRKGNKSWRPLQPSDYSGDADLELGSSSSLAEASGAQTYETSPKPSGRSTPQFSHPGPQAALQSDHYMPSSVPDNTASDPVAAESDKIDDSAPGDVIENYARIFGPLPDLIRLYEHTGDFDGQVVFIGHPDRNVSAHQWSSASFQWMNIGLWSHARRKIEGLLASEPLKTKIPPNTVEYFKAVAEKREADKRDMEQKAKVVKSRPHLSDADRMASLSTLSDSPSSPALPRPNRSDTATTGRAVYSSSRTIAREDLEDPFVTPARPPQPAVPTSLSFGGVTAVAKGSMDLAYKFPARTLPVPSDYGMSKSNLASQLAYVQREKERLDLEDLARDHENQVPLREISVGEEAAGVAQPRQMSENWPRLSFSPEDMRKHQQLKIQLTEPGDQAHRPSYASEHRAVPEAQMLNTNIRALFPPGPTVANPYRGGSTLNANAAPYTGMSKAPIARESRPPAAAITALPPASLCFSDPDNMRQTRIQAIANGPSKQAPTPQNFYGPFFRDSMPSARELAAPRSQKDMDLEELNRWFQDGQRPLHQQEYAKSLVYSSVSENKLRHLGAIGETPAKNHVRDKYEHTSFLVRALANLAEYAEESRTGARSYFTRAWKPAPLAACDLSPEGNDSFFEKSVGEPPLEHIAPAYPRSFFRSGGEMSSTPRSQHSSQAFGGF